MMLLDTDIFVDYLRNFPSAVSFFHTLTQKNDVFFSAISEAELVAGSANTDKEKKLLLLRLLFRFHKLEVNNPTAVLAGDLARDYALEIPDAIIAATAILHNAELLTRNAKDFKKIKGLVVVVPY